MEEWSVPLFSNLTQDECGFILFEVRFTTIIRGYPSVQCNINNFCVGFSRLMDKFGRC